MHMPDDRTPPSRLLDVVCVGAGFAGMYAVHRLHRSGFEVLGLEAAGDVGGTWLWNAYPGARCDIDSYAYSYSFSEELQQEWTWSERFATQPEILRYANHVADRFDLRRHFRFNTRVIAATWHESSQHWSLKTELGDTIHARHLLSAVGCLSTSKDPDIPGLSSFSGRSVSTGTWDMDMDELAGRRVGVIGTGSSGVQCIPLIAEVADRLTVFQRTPNYVLPARNAPMAPEQTARIKARYGEIRAELRTSHLGIIEEPPTQRALEVSDQERHTRYEAAYRVSGLTSVGSVFSDLLTDPEANETAAAFLREKVRRIVEDAETAEMLTPRFHPFGAKRTCLGTDYYETYNRSNVDLVSLRRTPIEEVTSTGVRTTAGLYELDVLVLATGFDAVTGSILRLNIADDDGRTLASSWQHGPRTYLGLMTAGFPNLYFVTGPQSPSVLTNVLLSIEQHVEFIVTLLEDARANGLTRIEAETAAQDEWVGQVADTVAETLYASTDSWYNGANVPGKARTFMAYAGGVGRYRELCQEVVTAGYRGLRRSRAAGATRPTATETYSSLHHPDQTDS